jgi:hypothetical protein
VGLWPLRLLQDPRRRYRRFWSRPPLQLLGYLRLTKIASTDASNSFGAPDTEAAILRTLETGGLEYYRPRGIDSRPRGGLADANLLPSL